MSNTTIGCGLQSLTSPDSSLVIVNNNNVLTAQNNLTHANNWQVGQNFLGGLAGGSALNWTVDTSGNMVTTGYVQAQNGTIVGTQGVISLQIVNGNLYLGHGNHTFTNISAHSQALGVSGDGTNNDGACGVIVAIQNMGTPTVGSKIGEYRFTSDNNGDTPVSAQWIGTHTGSGGTHGFGTLLTLYLKGDNGTVTNSVMTWAPTMLTSLTDVTVRNNLTVGSAGAAQGSLIIGGGTSGTLTLKSKSAAGNVTFAFPSADGSANQAIVTDGAGNWSFGNATSFVGAVANTDTVTLNVAGNGTLTAALVLSGGYAWTGLVGFNTTYRSLNDLGTPGSTIAVNWNNGDNQKANSSTTTAGTTVTFTNPSTSTRILFLHIHTTGGGAVPTLPTIKYPSYIDPTSFTGQDIVLGLWWDGTNYYCFFGYSA